MASYGEESERAHIDNNGNRVEQSALICGTEGLCEEKQFMKSVEDDG